MSSYPVLILMALTSFLTLSGSRFQAGQADSVTGLLLRDEVEKAESLLNQQPQTAESVALRGEIEYRKGNFETAETLYKQAIGMSEKTARAHFGIGKLALNKLKSKEAIRAMLRAIELDPKEPLFRLYAGEAYGLDKNYGEQRKHLQDYVKLNPVDDPDRLAEAKAALEMFESFGGSEIGVLDAPQNPAPIPFRKSLNLIFARVMVNGKGPFEFAVDTGASQIVLSDKLAMALGLKPVTSTIMHGVGGAGRVESKLYKVNELTVSDIKVKNVPVGTFSDPLLSQVADGIFGAAILSDFIVTINYPNNEIQLSKKAENAPSADTLPAWCFSNLLLVRLEVNGQQRGNFIVDTGAVTTVLSHVMAAKLGVTESTPGAKVDLGLTGVGGLEGVVLRVPNVTFKTTKNSETYPQVVSIDLKQISRMLGTEVSGVIGSDFFDEYKLTLDYFGAEVRLEK
jgi:predicted aspartyl protease